ncbi:MAG: dTDP-4-dehydrorhamnose reductase [Rhodocyclaceae bacterium]|nr:dTDP-4-dehydrorhamnose reductase [Rhodocyclaceae bacterium]
MRLLVTGALGQVGFELVRSLMPLGEVRGLRRQDCDLSNPEAIASTVAAFRPDVIVNAAAYTAVDHAEHEEPLAHVVNATAPGLLAEVAQRLGALLVHYSTDYVFDGAKDQPWTEDDPVGPLNAYGRSKLAGERAIARTDCDYLILRTSWVFASRGGNFVRTMLRLGAERESLRIVGDQIGAPTWARNIADATAQIVVHAQAERNEGSFERGVYHLASAGETSWHGFASAIFDHVRTHCTAQPMKVRDIVPIPASEYPLPALRPANSRLDCGKLERRYGIVMPPWRDALARCLEEIV